MIYADYEFYITVYAGNRITEAEWPACAREASAYIDCITYGRLKGHPERVSDDVKMAVCGVAEAVFTQNGIGFSHAAGIASESVGGQSVSYISPEDARKVKTKDMQAAADLYLSPSDPIRYAGVCGCW